MKLYFVTASDQKIRELQRLMELLRAESPIDVEFSYVRQPLQEVLDKDMAVIVKQKALDAYCDLGFPCVVEHGGLFMEGLKELPGSLGGIIWEAVGDRMCRFLTETDSRRAVARSSIAYCDGRQIHIYTGETPGRIAPAARGEYDYKWDTIFIPDGSDQTYGEMGMDMKLVTSQFARAWRVFLKAHFSIDLPELKAARNVASKV
jgi:XTP/dITP diphosphohydrolase